MNNPNNRQAIRGIRKAHEALQSGDLFAPAPVLQASLDKRFLDPAPGAIVVFLQNVWHPQPDRVRDLLARYPRQQVLPKLLFMGGKTGRILLNRMGEGLCGFVVWEEASTAIIGNPNDVPRAEPVHIRAVLAEYKPAVVLTLGKVAGDALAALPGPYQLLRHVHPARAPRAALEALQRDSVTLAARAGVAPP